MNLHIKFYRSCGMSLIAFDAFALVIKGFDYIILYSRQEIAAGIDRGLIPVGSDILK